MRDWLGRLSWPSVVVVALALGAVVGVVALLPSEARTDVILGLLALAGAAAGVAGAMPAAVRPSKRPAPRALVEALRDAGRDSLADDLDDDPDAAPRHGVQRRPAVRPPPGSGGGEQ